jgi:hypothetical protein
MVFALSLKFFEILQSSFKQAHMLILTFQPSSFSENQNKYLIFKNLKEKLQQIILFDAHCHSVLQFGVHINYLRKMFQGRQLCAGEIFIVKSLEK